jgi:hypothetical protein
MTQATTATPKTLEMPKTVPTDANKLGVFIHIREKLARTGKIRERRQRIRVKNRPFFVRQPVR